MHPQLGLNAKQKRVINKISKRLAAQQAAYLQTERECLNEFTQVVGYASPADARQFVMEQLVLDETGIRLAFFAEADWPQALTRIALKQRQELAHAAIEAALEKLNP